MSVRAVALAILVLLTFVLVQLTSGAQGFTDPNQVLTCADFTPANVIDVLADYDIRHLPELQDGGPGEKYWGLTQPWNHKIYLSDENSLADRREVVVHELLHAICYNKGIQTGGPGEAFIEQKAQEAYHRIYDQPFTPSFVVESPAEEPEEPK